MLDAFRGHLTDPISNKLSLSIDLELTDAKNGTFFFFSLLPRKSDLCVSNMSDHEDGDGDKEL